MKVQVSIPSVIQNKLAYLSAFTVQARSPVKRDRYTREVIFVGSESSPRLAKSLTQLCKGIALSFGRFEVQDGDFDFMLEIALSSIPSLRYKIISLLYNQGSLKFSEVHELLGLSETGVHRLLEDLRLLKVIDMQGTGRFAQYNLTNHALELINGFKPQSDETGLSLGLDSGGIHIPPRNAETNAERRE